MVVKMFSRVGFTFFKRIVVSVFILFLLAFESTNAAADHFTSEKYQNHNTNLLEKMWDEQLTLINQTQKDKKSEFFTRALLFGEVKNGH